MTVIACPAYAKINLALEVIGRRPDGYHEIVSIMQTISLHDTVRVEPADGLLVSCSNPALAGEENLCYRAAVELRQETGIDRGAALHVEKGIPVAGGLGGGSSDAAAALLALDRLWGTRLPPARLRAVAARLGSDVPYLLQGGTALVGGRGELVEPLPDAPSMWLVLASPGVVLAGKTATLYGLLSSRDYDDGSKAAAAAAAIRRGRFPSDDALVNTFEKVAEAAFPSLAATRRLVEGVARGGRAHLAGAGPTLWLVRERREEAERIGAALRSQGVEIYVASTGPWRPRPIELWRGG